MVRLVILVQGLFGLVVSNDPTYNIGFVTSAIETNLALITASAPALMPLLKSWFPSIFGGDTYGNTVSRKAPLRDATVATSSKMELRGQTPRDSEEEAMTYNGIVRQNDMVSREAVNFSRPDRPRSRPDRPPRPGTDPDWSLLRS